MKQCWCIPPEQNASFAAAMEGVLEVYSRPYDEAYPVVCMDEKPVQFFADFRKGFRSQKNGIQYEDYQYIRNGTACIFLFTEPLAGFRYADAQEHRTRQDWAKQIEWLLTQQYPKAKKVVVLVIGQALAPYFDKQVAVRSKGLSFTHSLWFVTYGTTVF